MGVAALTHEFDIAPLAIVSHPESALPATIWKLLLSSPRRVTNAPVDESGMLAEPELNPGPKIAPEGAVTVTDALAGLPAENVSLMMVTSAPLSGEGRVIVVAAVTRTVSNSFAVYA